MPPVMVMSSAEKPVTSSEKEKEKLLQELGFSNLLQRLLCAGADPSKPDDQGEMPLSIASTRPHHAAVAILHIATGLDAFSLIPIIHRWCARRLCGCTVVPLQSQRDACVKHRVGVG